MGKRGPKPKKIISEKWDSNLAYAIGLLVTDGCMSKTGHLIDLTSKDREQLLNYSRCLNIKNKIGKKNNGHGQMALRIQFRNVFFYKFLIKIGITPAKSKTLGPLKIPDKYFFDFLRGCFDGDGYTYSYWDKRWKSSFMFYIGFASASIKFVHWLQNTIFSRLGIKGHITTAGLKNICYQLKYAKKDGFKLMKKMFYAPDVICLTRKRLKIEETLSIVGKRL